MRSSRDLDMIWEIPEFNFRHALCLVPEFDELVALQKVEVGEGNADEQRAVIAGEWVVFDEARDYARACRPSGWRSLLVDGTFM